MNNAKYWRISPVGWFVIATVTIAILVAFRTGVIDLWNRWQAQEEYSHGQLIPLISAFLVFQMRDRLRVMEFQGSWKGVAVVFIGVSLLILGELSTITALVYYGLWITIGGLLFAWAGSNSMKLLWVPVAYLFFMIPLPGFFYNALSSKLQLLSSEIGVAVIRSFGISVFLEGNVIDLGSYKLQVVEACNGLRYLFPLMSFGFLCAYLFKAPLWQKIVVFLSTIPITVLMNSFRIGVIGFTVDRWGQEMAEGFLHDFEGWVVFMACLGVLFAIMFMLKQLSGDKRSFNEVFNVEIGSSAPAGVPFSYRRLRPQVSVALGLVGISLVMSLQFEHRRESIPARLSFESFPLELPNWKGSRGSIDQIYLDQLKLTDYWIADYRNSQQKTVNFYVAYYESQRTGESAHSPRSCLPGGGWQIKSLTQVPIAGVTAESKEDLQVNRALIQYADQRQLVYYWFQQRGRIITNEYLVKWYLFWDSLMKNRSDGALVRIITPLDENEKVDDADFRLREFTKEIFSPLSNFVPDDDPV